MDAVRFKHVRKRVLVLTQDEMAQALGVSRSLVGHYETGRNPIPPEVQERVERMSRESIGSSSRQTSAPVQRALSGKRLKPLTRPIPAHMAITGAFTIEVDDDSMMPLLHPGDLAILAPRPLAIGEAFLAGPVMGVLEHSGTEFVLRPMNPKHKPATFVRAEGMLLGYYRQVGTRITTDFDEFGLGPF
jgi:DNA-binding transcriptional regulator YdaS (Cro superfamily)